jgi:hypothetical protein
MHLVCHKDENFKINVSIGISKLFFLSQKNVIRLKNWKVTRKDTVVNNCLSLTPQIESIFLMEPRGQSPWSARNFACGKIGWILSNEERRKMFLGG